MVIKRQQNPARYEPTIEVDPAPDNMPQRANPGSMESRPWRQWHSSPQPVDTGTLEIAGPKRPQWGRLVYLAIILLVLAAIAKIVFGHAFWYNASGVIAGQNYAVSSTHAVRVEKVLVQPSDHVKAGQVLATLKSPELERKLAGDEAQLAKLQAQAARKPIANKMAALQAKKQGLQSQAQSLQTQLYAQQNQIRSMVQLVAANAANRGDLRQLETTNVSTQAQYAQTTASIQGINAQLRNYRAALANNTGEDHQQRIAALKRQRESIRHELNNMTLTAPVNGQIAQVNVSKGTVLKSGDPAMVVVSNGQRRAYLYFPASAQSRLRSGQKITVTGPDGRQLHMRVDHVYPSLQDAPIASKNKPRFDSPKVVVAARPINGNALPSGMHSGTPVTSRITRWSLP